MNSLRLKAWSPYLVGAGIGMLSWLTFLTVDNRSESPRRLNIAPRGRTLTLIGLVLLWKCGARGDVPWSGKTIIGANFLGWGLFNFVEGIIDHHILNIHHVVESHGQSMFDYLFFASGLIFIVAGWMAIRSARSDPALPRSV